MAFDQSIIIGLTLWGNREQIWIPNALQILFATTNRSTLQSLPKHLEISWNGILCVVYALTVHIKTNIVSQSFIKFQVLQSESSWCPVLLTDFCRISQARYTGFAIWLPNTSVRPKVKSKPCLAQETPRLGHDRSCRVWNVSGSFRCKSHNLFVCKVNVFEIKHEIYSSWAAQGDTGGPLHCEIHLYDLQPWRSCDARHAGSTCWITPPTNEHAPGRLCTAMLDSCRGAMTHPASSASQNQRQQIWKTCQHDTSHTRWVEAKKPHMECTCQGVFSWRESKSYRFL